MKRALLVALLLVPLAQPAQASDADVVERALSWLADDASGFPRAYHVEASAQAGRDPKLWPTPRANAFGELAPYESGAGSYYSYLRVAHAAGTAGYDPRDVNGLDYVALVRGGFSNGQFGEATYVNDDVWAILALRAAGVPATDPQIQSAALFVEARQLPDGGWAHALPALRSSTDVTGAALAALAAAGSSPGPGSSARAFLDSTFDAPSGGHLDMDTSSARPNCQSTVWALHGYAALGVEERPESLAFLRGLQRPSGGFATSSSSSSPDVFCTTEAIPVLAGARYPLPSFEPLAPPRPSAHVGETISLSVPPPFTRATWTLDEGAREGTQVELSFAFPGRFPYRLLAEGPGVRSRAEGTIEVRSARPELGGFPPEVRAFRRDPIAIDLRNASDPDGAIARFEIAWGDGAWTNTTERVPSHAYAFPGEFALRVRALDDAGEWSEPASILVRVPNRAPTLAPLPARIVGDRVNGATIDVVASDPDGDALLGAGPRRISAGALGNHTIPIVVADPYGAQARANVTIEIVNLPPRVEIDGVEALRAGREGTLRARAIDDDGPPPAVVWLIDGARAEGVETTRRFDAGTHELRAIATDADGASVEAHAAFFLEPDAAPLVAPAPEATATEATPEPAAPVPAPSTASPSPILVQAKPREDAAEPVAQASVKLVETPQETPMPAWLAMAALVAALLAKRGRRGRSA